MIILFNDIIQKSDAPLSLKTPALAETANTNGSLTISLEEETQISAIGIGNTDGEEFEVAFNDAENTKFSFQFKENGLYPMKAPVFASFITIQTDANFIGRFAAGLGVKIPTAIAKQPGWHSTSEPRTSLSGQILPGAGGYNYRTLSLDSRYKLGPDAVRELVTGYKQIGEGFPFFINFDTEHYKLPYQFFYATEQNQRAWALEGGIRRFLYSYRFNFTEAF